MAQRNGSFWHTLGHTMEVALQGASRGRRGPWAVRVARKLQAAPAAPISGLLTGAATAFFATAGKRWSRSRRPSIAGLVRGAAAGAGAAGALYAVRRLAAHDGAATDRSPREVGDELLAGAGRGVLYATLLAPYLPGPPLVRGVVAGSADYFAAPIGGLFARLQPISPIRKIPVISILLETGDAEEDPYLAFLFYGAVLGLLYGNPDGDD